MSEEAYLRTLARFHGDIRTGALAFDYRTGQCGPVQATQTRSWGAACPSGYCPPGNLPAALNRWFAGERAGCREIPYTILLAGIGIVLTDVAVSRTLTSKVDMCPTRIIASVTVGTSTWRIDSIEFGSQNQILGSGVPAGSLDPGAFQPVPIVPDCIRAGQPFTIDATILAGVAAAAELAITFIGPVVG